MSCILYHHSLSTPYTHKFPDAWYHISQNFTLTLQPIWFDFLSAFEGRGNISQEERGHMVAFVHNIIIEQFLVAFAYQWVAQLFYRRQFRRNMDTDEMTSLSACNNIIVEFLASSTPYGRAARRHRTHFRSISDFRWGCIRDFHFALKQRSRRESSKRKIPAVFQDILYTFCFQ